MHALKINRRVTHDGILIPIDMVKDFENKDVEIIILPVSEQSTALKNNFMSFAGKLSETDANEMLMRINECRIIDEDTWK